MAHRISSAIFNKISAQDHQTQEISEHKNELQVQKLWIILYTFIEEEDVGRKFF